MSHLARQPHQSCQSGVGDTNTNTTGTSTHTCTHTSTHTRTRTRTHTIAATAAAATLTSSTTVSQRGTKSVCVVLMTGAPLEREARRRAAVCGWKFEPRQLTRQVRVRKRHCLLLLLVGKLLLLVALGSIHVLQQHKGKEKA